MARHLLIKTSFFGRFVRWCFHSPPDIPENRLTFAAPYR